LVLDEALRGEAASVDAYDDAVTDLLPPNARPIIERQHEEVRGTLRELSEFALPM
jgi:hypothetical protein